MKIRVAMLIHDYYPLIGGAQALLRSQAARLMDRGIDVVILTRSVRGEAPLEVIEGVPVHRLPAWGPRAVASVCFVASAVRLIARLKPDVLHAHEFISPATVALAAHALWGIPLVVTPHRSGPLGDIQRLQGRPGGGHRLNALRKNVEALVVISREIGHELMSAHFQKTRLHDIRNGVDTIKYSPLPPPQKRALRISLNLPEHAPIVVFTGRLVPEKRVNQLLSVWPLIRAACPAAMLLIIGAGEQWTELKAMAGPGVQMMGAIDDVTPYLKASDIFVLPSAAEGLSVAMLEAMSAGLAPVVTDVGGASEVISHLLNGILIAPDAISELKDALLLVLQDESLRYRLGLMARRRVVTDFSVDHSVDALCHLYQNFHLGSRGL